MTIQPADMNPATDTKPATTIREIRGNTRTHQRTSQDVFEANVARLPEAQREILQWWYYHQIEEDLTFVELGKRAGVSPSSFSRAFSGRYGASLDSLCARLEAAKDNLHASVENPDFIMTALGKQLWEIFDEARALRTVIFVWGVKGIGKTTVSKEYRRKNNHGRTHYHRCSPAMTFGQFVTTLAATLGISSKRHSHLRLREKIITTMAAGNRLLLLDEFHQIFIRRERGTGSHAVLICEFIREIFDRAECGVCLLGTKAMLTEFMQGDHAAALEQLLDRGEDPVELPDKPTKADAAAVISHYGLDPEFQGAEDAATIVRDLFAAHGLRKLVIRLRGGAAFAAKRGEPYTWNHFVRFTNRLASITRKK